MQEQEVRNNVKQARWSLPSGWEEGPVLPSQSGGCEWKTTAASSLDEAPAQEWTCQHGKVKQGKQEKQRQN